MGILGHLVGYWVRGCYRIITAVLMGWG